MQKNSGANTTNRKRNAKRNTVPFEDVLRSELQDRDIAIGYINSLLADGDEQGVLLALRDIADAMSMGAVAKSAGVNRESLYKMLSGRRDPRFGTVLRLLKGIGIKLNAVDTHPTANVGETRVQEPLPKAASLTGGVSPVRPKAYVRYGPFSYRPGVCPLDPGKRCLDIVPCAAEGGATGFFDFQLPIWSGMRDLANDEMAYAG